MPKKSDLGHKINKSLDAMSSLLEALGVFVDMPLKEGLSAANAPKDDKLTKAINDVLVDASALAVKVTDLKNDINKVRPAANSRFDTVRTAHAVIEKFLDKQN